MDHECEDYGHIDEKSILESGADKFRVVRLRSSGPQTDAPGNSDFCLIRMYTNFLSQKGLSSGNIAGFCPGCNSDISVNLVKVDKSI